jgi:hypothetical protein
VSRTGGSYPLLAEQRLSRAWLPSASDPSLDT